MAVRMPAAFRLAFVVGVAVNPVELFKLLRGETGDVDHGVVRRGVGLTSENHSVVENNRAQSQRSS